jgi:hypothetical protein
MHRAAYTICPFSETVQYAIFFNFVSLYTVRSCQVSRCGLFFVGKLSSNSLNMMAVELPNSLATCGTIMVLVERHERRRIWT